MLDNAIIEKVLSIPDNEKGGDNALDGFEFQVSSAIYLIFEEIRNRNNFALIYEKIEDFIIFTDKIHLYQAKSISRNLTPNVLYAPSGKTKNNNCTLSIIEKMNENYSLIKQSVSSCDIDNNLIICENQVFSKKLSKNIPDIKELRRVNFELLDIDAKSEIINNTKNNSYEWSSINAVRLIPKSRHEEVTRIFIEDVIKDIIGENKINSLALYNSLTSEIRKIRKEKTKLTNEFIIAQINKFAIFDEDLKFSDYVHLLNDIDKKSIPMSMSFNTIQNYIKIPNHPNRDDYIQIKDIYKNNNFNNLDDIYIFINTNKSFKDMCIRLNEFEIKALILIVIGKEMN